MTTLNFNKPNLVVNPLHVNGNLGSTSLTAIYTATANHGVSVRTLRVTNTTSTACTLLAQTMDASNSNLLKAIFNNSVPGNGSIDLGPLTLDELDAIKLTAGTSSALDWVLTGDDCS